MDDPQLKSLMDTYHKMLQQDPGDEFEAEPLTEQISFTVGSTGGSSARRQQKVNKAADAGVPNAAAKAKGPLLPGSMVKLANSFEEEGEKLEEAYDIVLEFLISEGYADSVENADKIMAVMAENKIKEIVEAKSKDDPCWKNYTQVGMKMKGGKEVPNCVPSKGVEKAKGYKKD